MADFAQLAEVACRLGVRRASGPDLAQVLLDAEGGPLSGAAILDLLDAADVRPGRDFTALVCADPTLGLVVAGAVSAVAAVNSVGPAGAADAREALPGAGVAPKNPAPLLVLTPDSDTDLVAGHTFVVLADVASREAYTPLRAWVEGAGGTVVAFAALADDGAHGHSYVDRSGALPRVAALATRTLPLREAPQLRPIAPGTARVTPGHSPYAEQPTAGVGPWAEEYPDAPLPDGSRWDQRLLAEGDHRNVVDAYRYWTVDAIRADLASRRAPLHVAIENLTHDLNIGSIVRTANAFNAGGVHIVGRHKWNRRGALVTDRYLDMLHHPDAEGLRAWADAAGYTLVAIDNQEGATAIEHTALPERCVLVFGQEQSGISAELLAACDSAVEITQYGSTRSLNVAAAAAIAMYAWARQHL